MCLQVLQRLVRFVLRRYGTGRSSSVKCGPYALWICCSRCAVEQVPAQPSFWIFLIVETSSAVDGGRIRPSEGKRASRIKDTLFFDVEGEEKVV